MFCKYYFKLKYLCTITLKERKAEQMCFNNLGIFYQF
jgi:hypothetical protein